MSFPTSIKDLRKRFPKGVLVRCEIRGDDGEIVSYEGKLGDEFFRVIDVWRNHKPDEEEACPTSS